MAKNLQAQTASRVPAKRKFRRTKRPGHRLQASQIRRANGRCETFKARFEYVGLDYDDVLVTLEYDERAVAAIRALPRWARRWDGSAKVWRIHPGYSERLAVDLRHCGYTVYGQSAEKA
jgi:hypothetical protein